MVESIAQIEVGRGQMCCSTPWPSVSPGHGFRAGVRPRVFARAIADVTRHLWRCGRAAQLLDRVLCLPSLLSLSGCRLFCSGPPWCLPVFAAPSLAVVAALALSVLPLVSSSSLASRSRLPRPSPDLFPSHPTASSQVPCMHRVGYGSIEQGSGADLGARMCSIGASSSSSRLSSLPRPPSLKSSTPHAFRNTRRLRSAPPHTQHLSLRTSPRSACYWFQVRPLYECSR